MVRNYLVMMSDGGGGIPKPIKPKPISNVGKSIINTYKSQSYLSKTILSNVNSKVKAIQSKSIGSSATSVLGSRTSLLNNKYINGISIIAQAKRASKYCTTNNTVNEEEPGSPGYEFVNAYYLNDSSRVFGQGHSAILLEMENGEAYYFSVVPDNAGKDAIKIITAFDVSGHIDTAYKNGNYQSTINIHDFLFGNSNISSIGVIRTDSQENQKRGDKYDRYVKIPITNDEGRKMFDKANELLEKYAIYNLYENNCGMIALIILEAGNKNFIETGKWSAQDERNAIVRTLYQFAVEDSGINAYKELKGIYNNAWNDNTVPNAAYNYVVEQINNNNPNMKGWEYGDIKK